MDVETMLKRLLEEQPPEYCQWFTGICLPRPEWASWVQAIGAVLALVVAAGVVIAQHWLNERVRRVQREQMLEMNLNAMHRVVARTLGNVWDIWLFKRDPAKVETEERRIAWKAILAIDHRTLCALNAHDLPARTSYIWFFDIRSTLEEAIELLGSEQPPESGGVVPRPESYSEPWRHIGLRLLRAAEHLQVELQNMEVRVAERAFA